MAETKISLGPPQLDFIDVPVGVGARLSFQLGTEGPGGAFVPDDLTGREGEMVLWPGERGQLRHALTTENAAEGRMAYAVPNSFTRPTPYLVLVAETPGGAKVPRMGGNLSPGVAVTP